MEVMWKPSKPAVKTVCLFVPASAMFVGDSGSKRSPQSVKFLLKVLHSPNFQLCTTIAVSILPHYPLSVYLNFLAQGPQNNKFGSVQ